MNSKRKVLDKLEVIRTIFINSFNSYQAWRYLRELTDKDLLEQIKLNNMFRSYDYFLYFNNIIELAKLFENKENTQKFNLHNFLLKLERNLPNSDYNGKITLDFILKKKEELNGLAISIGKVSEIRTHYYAHTDKDFIIPTKYIIDFREFDEMFECAENVITETYFNLTGISENIRVNNLQQSTENIIRELVKFNKLKSNPELELWKYYD